LPYCLPTNATPAQRCQKSDRTTIRGDVPQVTPIDLWYAKCVSEGAVAKRNTYNELLVTS
jgi:hypothetical protein